MRIAAAEIKKLWKNKIFYILIFITVVADLLLLTNNIVNTKTKVPPSAYRIFAHETANMDMQEKKRFIEEKNEMIEAIFVIDYAARTYKENKKQGEIIKQDNIEAFEKYAADYVSGSYLHYTDSLTRERLFINNIQYEFEQVYNYQNYLDDIEKKAQYASIFSGIAGNSNNYSTQNTLKTSQAYVAMHDISPQYQPQRSLVNALNFIYTDIMLVLSVFLIGFLIVWQEKNSGMLRIVLSTPNGRRKTGGAKIAALAVSVLFATAVMYGANILICTAFYGRLNLFVPIQSYVFLMGSVLKVNLLTYLALYIAMKWLAAFLIGLIFMLCMLWAKSLFGGMAMCGGITAVFWLLRQGIVPTSKYNAIRYLNPISLIRTNDTLVLYRNVNLLGKPIDLMCSQLIFAAVFVLLLCAAFIISLYRAQGVYCARFRLPRIIKRKKRKTVYLPLFWQENKKLMLTCGAVFIIAAAVLFEGYAFMHTDKETSLDEAYYAYYMTNITGRMNADKKEFLENESKVFEPVYQAQKDLREGKMIEEQYSEFVVQNALLFQKYNAYCKAVQKVRRQLQTGDGYVVYDTGYLKLLGIDKLNPLRTFETVMLCILATAFYSCIEGTSKMPSILRSTPMGRKRLAKIKEKQLLLCAAFITVAVNIFDFVFVGIKYGYKGLFLPAKAVYELNFMPRWISIFMLVLLVIGLKFLFAAAVCFTVHAVGTWLKSPLYTLAAATLVFGVPTAICSMGIGWIKWLSFIPLDNAGCYLTHRKIVLLLYSSAAAVLTVLSAKLARAEIDN